ncbi:MAG: alanine dehydrogenase [Planctomycetales bacterium]
MIVGVPREIKSDEYRVGLLPSGVEDLIAAGQRVLVERGAGLGSGIIDEDYAASAEIVPRPKNCPCRDDHQGKEPLAASGRCCVVDRLSSPISISRPVSNCQAVLNSGVTAVAYETVAWPPDLLPDADERSGGADEHSAGSKVPGALKDGGILLGGVPGVPPHHRNSGWGDRGAERSADCRRVSGRRQHSRYQHDAAAAYLGDIMPNVNTVFSDRHNVLDQISRADLVIGAVLIEGARAPRLVRADDLKIMKPGAVIIDVAIDQGGCVETSRPTTHSKPTYIEQGVVHYCVTNMPGAVGRTSTYALCNVTFPYALKIAKLGLAGACAQDPGLAHAVNMHQGKVTNKAVSETFRLPYEEYKP